MGHMWCVNEIVPLKDGVNKLYKSKVWFQLFSNVKFGVILVKFETWSTSSMWLTVQVPSLCSSSLLCLKAPLVLMVNLYEFVNSRVFWEPGEVVNASSSRIVCNQYVPWNDFSSLQACPRQLPSSNYVCKFAIKSAPGAERAQCHYTHSFSS